MKKEQMLALVKDLKDRQKWHHSGTRRQNQAFDRFWNTWIKPSLDILEKELEK